MLMVLMPLMLMLVVPLFGRVVDIDVDGFTKFTFLNWYMISCNSMV